ncbi:8677_t:CDS:2, partial [Gigaspora rosea]
MFEPIILQEYLNKLLLLVLEAEEADLKATLWSIPETTEKLCLFTNDSQVKALYITKSKKDTNDGSYNYTISHTITYHLNDIALISITKHNDKLDPYYLIQSQIQFLNLPGPAISEYVSTSMNSHEEAIYSCIHYSVAPYFDAYVANNDYNEINKNMMIIKFSKQEGRRATIEYIDLALLGDIAFLNKLQSDVKSWIKEIKKVIQLSRDPSNGMTIQEINFWLNKETALEKIKNQINSDQIVLTLNILGHAQHFHATTSFANIGLKEAKEQVHKYNVLMKDFPIEELLSAPDVTKIKEALCAIFAHYNKKMRITQYPIKKTLALVEAISHGLNDILIKVLGDFCLMYMEYKDFEKVMSDVEDVFKTWDVIIREFTNVARDVMHKHSDKFVQIKIDPVHDKLQERIEFIRNFRKQHEQLYQTIVNTMIKIKDAIKIEDDVVQQQESITINKIDFLEEINVAYKSVKDINVLDISVNDTEIWMKAEFTYNECVSRYNALFVKPKIRSAIQKYQNELIDKVKNDISKLYNKFSQQYYKSGANYMAQLRDLPTISGFMIWAHQIEIQLHIYMKRIEDVL